MNSAVLLDSRSTSATVLQPQSPFFAVKEANHPRVGKLIPSLLSLVSLFSLAKLRKSRPSSSTRAERMPSVSLLMPSYSLLFPLANYECFVYSRGNDQEVGCPQGRFRFVRDQVQVQASLLPLLVHFLPRRFRQGRETSSIPSS